MRRNFLALLWTLVALSGIKLVHDHLVTCFDPYHDEQMVFVKVQESIFRTQVDSVLYEADQLIRDMQEPDGQIQVVQKEGPSMTAMRRMLGVEHEAFTLMSLGRHKIVLGLRLQHKSLSIQLVIFPSWDDVSDVHDVRWIWKHIGLLISDVRMV